MTDAVDLVIRARFEAVANSSDDRDWNDVLARAHGSEIPAERSVRRTGFWRRVPARVALVAAVVALAVVVTAVALGWPQKFVNFLSSPPAPTHIKNWFSAINVTVPPGMNLHTISRQAKKITTARFNAGTRGARPRLHTLYIAPIKGGGFCYQWSGPWHRIKLSSLSKGACGTAQGPPVTAPRWLRAYGPLWIKFPGGSDPYLILGEVRRGATRTVEARFADGTTTTIPVTWVSAPINTGFIAYPVPRSQWHRYALRSVVALDAKGRVIGSRSPVGASVMAGMRMTMPPATTVVGGRVAVPNLIDLRLDLAERTLTRDHLLGFEGFRDNPRKLPDKAKHYWVCFQLPKAGKRVSTGTRVALLFARDCHQ